MAKSAGKKTETSSKNAKKEFRIVKDYPLTTKINKADIEKAVGDVIALTSKQ